MTNRRNRISLIIAITLIMVLFISFLSVNSFSRYVSEQSAKYKEDDNTILDYIDFTVNSVFVVRSQDELFSAINQGYSFVQLDKSIENPLIVTQKAETLDRDLILDLNGIEIQRNGYDPILNVKEGVRLTIVDTSDEQTGGLYNPVGSVFNIVGGTLTVVAGAFESGPRYSEYYSYNNLIIDNSSTSGAKRTIVESTAQNVLYYKKDNDTGKFVASTESKQAPIITSYPVVTGDIKYNHGNLYFDQEVTKGNVTIPPDTYCYYRTSEDSAANTTDIPAADWYYKYFVNSSYSYVGTEKKNDTDIEITIYGYENIISKASGKTSPSDYLAAIQMSTGTLDIQSGSFNSYFGVDTTACVNAQGGEIQIKSGYFSSRIPNAIKYDNGKVTVKESDKASFNESYFDNFIWGTPISTQDISGYIGDLAKQGQSYCILNGGSANVNIGQGNFYSSNNNIISMQGGSLSVNSGTFTKRMINGTTEGNKEAAIHMESGALSLSNANCYVYGDQSIAVNMTNGTLSLSNATCNIQGEKATAVKISSGELTIDSSSFTIVDDKSAIVSTSENSSIVNACGIHSSISSTTDFKVINTDFNITGAGAVGIYSQEGQVNLESTANNSITINGASSKGIYVLSSGSVHSTNYTYTVVGENSYGIKADSTASGINISEGSMNVAGTTAFGIHSEIAGNDKFTVNNFSIIMTTKLSPSDTTYPSNQTGIYSANGNVQLTTNKGSTISVNGSNSRGIHTASGGSVTSDYYSYNIDGENSYGIYAEAGTVNVSNGNIYLTSNITNYGIYAASLESTVQIQIELKQTWISVGYGKDSKSTSTMGASVGVFLSAANISSYITLTDTSIDSYELGVVSNGGNITLSNTTGASSTINTKNASAIAIRSGSVIFDSTSKYTITSSNTTQYQATNSYAITLPVSKESELVDTNYVNTDGIYVNGGSFTSNGTLNVTHNGLQNATIQESYTESYLKTNSSTYNYTSLNVTSYAIRVLGGSVSITGQTDITANIGGGIYLGKATVLGTSAGSVNLGSKTSTEQNSITVQTLGTLVGGLYNAISVGINSTSWMSYQSITGGHAIEVQAGNIIVYNGNYTAEFGNGILANGGGTIDIYGGTFKGFMHVTYTAEATFSTVLTGKSGPSAFYGLKVTGGATVNIYDGTFDGGNGGAFITGVIGISNRTITETSTANVYIYKGTFGGENAGLDAFNVYTDANVVFGAGGSSYFGADADADTFKQKIVLNSGTSSIAVNAITNQTGGGDRSHLPSVTVYYGIYKGNMYCDSTNFGTSNLYSTYNVKTGYTKVTQIKDGVEITGTIYGDMENSSDIFYPKTISND